LLLFFSLFILCASARLVLDPKAVERFHKQENTWTATLPEQFLSMSVEEFSRNYLGTILPKNNSIPYYVTNPPPEWRPEDKELLKAGLPADFNWKTADPGCVHPIMNQGNCGSCWAFGATEALSDRFCLWSKGRINVVLSPQELVSCDHEGGCNGCGGGMLAPAWEFMKKPGMVTIQCLPYYGTDARCPSKCANGAAPVFFHAANAYGVPSGDIMAEIYTHGPVEAAFTVYQDFMSYAGGVYSHSWGSELGGHAIKMVGWGVTEQGVDYWICANSWGPEWGPYGGFFGILRGQNECGIESNVYAGYPAV